jgi:hypothetical protein
VTSFLVIRIVTTIALATVATIILALDTLVEDTPLNKILGKLLFHVETIH